jgi:retron-type reverse transcriptase
VPLASLVLVSAVDDTNGIEGMTNSPREDTAVCQNLVPLVNIKIAGKWIFIPLKIVLIGIDPYPYM